jgi:hypothetical protein
MLTLFACIFIFIISVISVKSDKPGKALIWSFSAGEISEISATYHSKTVDTTFPAKILQDCFHNYQAIVLLKPLDNSDLSDLTLNSRAMELSKSKKYINGIYNNVEGSSINAEINKLNDFQNVKTVKASEFLEIINSLAAKPAQDKKTTIYNIHEHFSKDDLFFQQIKELSSKVSILFVAFEEPSSDAFPPRQGEYNRVLSKYVSSTYNLASTTVSLANTSNPKSIYYLPEGAEYSIYYADTYLYITPDIFTGLMTGLFVFFAILIGFFFFFLKFLFYF